MATIVFQVKNMDCASCAALIESDLEDAGFKASCSYAKQILEVEHDGKLKSDKVTNIVKQAGYDLVQ